MTALMEEDKKVLRGLGFSDEVIAEFESKENLKEPEEFLEEARRDYYAWLKRQEQYRMRALRLAKGPSRKAWPHEGD